MLILPSTGVLRPYIMVESSLLMPGDNWSPAIHTRDKCSGISVIGLMPGRRRQSLRATLIKRPDLLETADLTDEDRKVLEELKKEHER